MLMTVVAGVLVLTAASPPAPIGTAAAAEGPAEPASKADVVADEEKVKCRSIRVTGSRMAERVCGTQKNWKRREETAKKWTEKLQEGDRWYRSGSGDAGPIR